MLDKIKHIFKRNPNLIPDPKTQANIGQLAVYYLDRALTRIDILIESGKSSIARAEYEIIYKHIQQLNHPQSPIEFQDTANTSVEIKLAMEYVEKLFRLVNDLVEASDIAAAVDKMNEVKKRTKEITALKVFFDEITRRLERFQERFPTNPRNRRKRKGK